MDDSYYYPGGTTSFILVWLCGPRGRKYRLRKRITTIWGEGVKFEAVRTLNLTKFRLKGGYGMPILTCICFTFNLLTLTSEMHVVKFHPEVASCLLSRGKRKYAPLGMRLLWKYIRKYFLVYHLISHFFLYLSNYKEFEAEVLDLQSEKYGLSFDNITTSGWALGDENMIGIRAFKNLQISKILWNGTLKNWNSFKWRSYGTKKRCKKGVLKVAHTPFSGESPRTALPFYP